MQIVIVVEMIVVVEIVMTAGLTVAVTAPAVLARVDLLFTFSDHIMTAGAETAATTSAVQILVNQLKFTDAHIARKR